MYHTEKNPLKKVLGGKAEAVPVVKQGRVRRLHKAFLRYHDPDNWPLLRDALKDMGREDLIGSSKKHLIPSYQPAGTGRQPEGTRTPRAESGRAKPGPSRPHASRAGAGKPAASKAGSGKAATGKPTPAKPAASPSRPAKPAPAKRGSDKPASGKPAPTSRGRPPQVPKHPLSQRRGGGKSR
jgi:hypothetical protein